MKRNSFLLAAIFLLAIGSLLLVSAPHPVQASAHQDPIPDEEQPAGFSLRQLFSGWGGFFVALALIWLVTSAIMAVRDVIITKNTHGPGVGHW
jgi:cell division protein FtsW (lipid II flippase)